MDCVRWEEDDEWKGTLEKNHSLVTYNDFAQEVIARYKFRGDYVLSKAFAALIQKKLRSIPFDMIVPIPLSAERQYERGFNQSEALILACGREPHRLLTRTHTEKQSKKSRSDRIHFSQVFQIAERIPDQKILLIDDIYTTGSTLRHAAKQLIAAGANSVSSLTIARG
ncbi:ComF family protein [Bacillus sp. FJAT-29790]|uniref:ComF family protein n=1 Tax=Bacillus sp. FJAT-29790 TaxID=1895002 RepID=UPI0020B35BE0|nr:ComF family protein [Bacillus sp. FJAT-29790]